MYFFFHFIGFELSYNLHILVTVAHFVFCLKQETNKYLINKGSQSKRIIKDES